MDFHRLVGMLPQAEGWDDLGGPLRPCLSLILWVKLNLDDLYTTLVMLNNIELGGSGYKSDLIPESGPLCQCLLCM